MRVWEKKPKRFFAFGCSFTVYNWATWANILAFELGPDVEFYNFGLTGAGNRYIATTIAQADEYFDFNEDDLVIVCWTNITRHDFFDERHGQWQVPGNIETQTYFDRNYVENYTCLGDFYFSFCTYMKLASEMLKKTNSHHLQMADVVKRPGVFRKDKYEEPEKSIIKLHEKVLSKLQPCFFETLWNFRNGRKYAYNRTLHPKFGDLHPTPKEHMKYLEKTFDIEFSQKTYDRVGVAEHQLGVGLHEDGTEIAPGKKNLGAGIFTLKFDVCHKYDVLVRTPNKIPECFIV